MDKKNYKDTLLMPKTNFEMRGNLAKKDSHFFSYWQEKDLINKIKRKTDKRFILHDGPPYANGNIHLGHAVNKILKDIIVRQKLLLNNNIEFIPGWDTHGLPIENEVQKLGIKVNEVGIEKYIEYCFKYARKQVAIQEKAFKKLHLLADFDHKYLTYQSEYIANEIKIFHKMLNDNFIYQDLKPVHWSWSSKSALAEAEIEYKDLPAKTIYVKFNLKNKDYKILIWTTTPWTIPGNVAIAFGENIAYALVEIENEKFIIAKELIDKLSREFRKEIKFLKDFNISNLIGQEAFNPLNNHSSRLVYGHHVNVESGTGVVHIAGGHGEDDYQIVKKEKLDLLVVMDDEGKLINSDKYDGIFYQKANKLIIDDLVASNSLFFQKDIIHSAAIDWRTKEPIVFRATKQWFFSFKDLKGDLTSVIEDVKWFPSWGEERLKKMIINRNDWCISRQRLWGVPIPIIYDQNNKAIIDPKLQDNIEKLFLKEGILGWRKAKISDLLPEDISYNEMMRKEEDILDVWFDSGSSHKTLLNDKIADLYLEGNDQYRGWFNSSLITSYVINKRPPYKTVITHGFTTDKNGNKMSKSLGNVITPNEISDKYGVDILRLWIGSANYFSNIKISSEILNTVISDYKKIRNTLRFILANIDDYDHSFKGEYSLISKTVLSNLGYIQSEILKEFKEYNFAAGLKILMNELNNGSLSYYLDYLKDILYIESKDDPLRREGQEILEQSFKFILFIIAPFLPVTGEEGWQNYKFNNNTLLFENNISIIKENNNALWEEFNQIKEEVNQVIEKLRFAKTINRSFEAEIDLKLPNWYKKWDLNNLNDLLLVAKVNLTFSHDGQIEVRGNKFDGLKCERCWKFFPLNEMKGDICKRCAKVLSKK